MTGYGMVPVFLYSGITINSEGETPGAVSFPLAQVFANKAMLMICCGRFFVKDLDFFRFIKRAAEKNA